VATGYSGRAPRGLPAWESRDWRRACDSSGSAARLDPDLAPPALRPRLRGIPSERVFAAATVGCRRCGGPGSAGFASGSGSPGAGDGALGGGLARKALRRGGAGFTELEVTSWVISPAFPTLHGGLVLPSARLLWQFRVVHDGWLRGPGCRSDVGLASSGDSSSAVAPSALVLEGLAPDFATTSGDDIFNFSFVFHIDQET